ncbi:actin-related protein 2/3 complex subunit 3-like [Trifolium pratense]|uniref:Actin-related protein 2/3 complex subunit 3-like n=1 Tax=Trifolium pratense TaxID=57577 RepID=A0A2K3NFV2_TRIPR|nr:actin-related protein 2/3 complex subunit 3-like [Trifolium pratense]
MVDRTDIVDEAITFFRANVFFRNFDIKSPADKLLIYLTFYINVALKRLEGCRTLAEGTKAVINLGLENVPVPGESGFPFPGLFPLPQSHKEAESSPKDFYLFVQLAYDLSDAFYIGASGLPLNVIATNVSQCNCIALHDILFFDKHFT